MWGARGAPLAGTAGAAWTEDTIAVPRPEGVYVYDGNGVDHVRLFDHDGNYVRTIYPFPAAKLKQVKGLKLANNAGQQNALLAGLLAVRKKVDCAITIDADLQDDVSAIEKMIDSVQEEVRQAVRQAIADAGPGGGYILSSSNSVHSSCDPRNRVAMVEAAREYGPYSSHHQ